MRADDSLVPQDGNDETPEQKSGQALLAAALHHLSVLGVQRTGPIGIRILLTEEDAAAVAKVGGPPIIDAVAPAPALPSGLETIQSAISEATPSDYKSEPDVADMAQRFINAVSRQPSFLDTPVNQPTYVGLDDALEELQDADDALCHAYAGVASLLGQAVSEINLDLFQELTGRIRQAQNEAAAARCLLTSITRRLATGG